LIYPRKIADLCNSGATLASDLRKGAMLDITNSYKDRIKMCLGPTCASLVRFPFGFFETPCAD